MENDKLGYYSDLGVSQTASQEEIRLVYRALAKIYHPDVNKDKAATEKFRRITTAYEVLSDPSKRVAYDSSGRPSVPTQSGTAQAAQQEQKIPIVECSVCKKPTAQPRFLVFRHVVSVVFMTWVTPRAGVYCSACATKQAMRSTLTSAAFGWWGFPWGPIYTIRYGLANAFGGEANQTIDEQLMWQNAVAFGRNGNFELSGALASRLTSSKDKPIAEAAKKLRDAIQADGIRIKPLRSPWRFDISKTLIQIGAICIVPAAIGFIANASPDQKRIAPGSVDASSSQPNSFAAPSKSVSANVPLANQCKRVPSNAQIILQKIVLAESGHRISIRNGFDGNAIIKIRDQFGSRTLVSFFVGMNQTAFITGIPDGTYKIQFATGDAMLANCQGFIAPNASEFSGTETFNTTYTSTQIVSQELELTLFRVSGGNARIAKIDATTFQND